MTGKPAAEKYIMFITLSVCIVSFALYPEKPSISPKIEGPIANESFSTVVYTPAKIPSLR